MCVCVAVVVCKGIPISLNVECFFLCCLQVINKQDGFGCHFPFFVISEKNNDSYSLAYAS